MNYQHTCYIPVMGTGFTIDTPLKVAKYGISSVISLVDDVLIEQMRRFHCLQNNETYLPITQNTPQARSKRITAYLNLLGRLITKQVIKLQEEPFIEGSEITRYFELLPASPLKNLYEQMLATADIAQKKMHQIKLRTLVKPGNIDVNIMTKLDRFGSPAVSDAVAALDGYANSNLDSSVVFSAGFNPRVYGAITDYKDFLPNENEYIKKKIILKVSDYRSAFIQGKYLAKRGLWVSEYRIESALNCGGHAFVNDGYLMGPILEEFKQKKHDLLTMLHDFYNCARKSANLPIVADQYPTCFTAQGGIGTHQEQQFLLQYYELDAVGWGTPFMLVPEAVNVDEEHLQKLIAATEQDIELSNNSPLNVPIWNLRNSASENMRRKKIADHCPGSCCLKQYAKLNTEFTDEPICTASSTYQKQKLARLPKEGWTKVKLQKLTEMVLTKACICHDLAGAATKKYGIDPSATPAVCPGPNIVNFSASATLEEMFNHIYGRLSLPLNSNRQHMFLKELSIHIEVLQKELKDSLLGLAVRSQEKLQTVRENLLKGIEYYRNIAAKFFDGQKNNFISRLDSYKALIINIGS